MTGKAGYKKNYDKHLRDTFFINNKTIILLLLYFHKYYLQILRKYILVEIFIMIFLIFRFLADV